MRDPDEASELLLARLFVDAALRARFERDPMAVGREFGLDERALDTLRHADFTGLELAARSYSRKRRARNPVDVEASPNPGPARGPCLN